MTWIVLASLHALSEPDSLERGRVLLEKNVAFAEQHQRNTPWVDLSRGALAQLDGLPLPKMEASPRPEPLVGVPQAGPVAP